MSARLKASEGWKALRETVVDSTAASAEAREDGAKEDGHDVQVATTVAPPPPPPVEHGIFGYAGSRATAVRHQQDHVCTASLHAGRLMVVDAGGHVRMWSGSALGDSAEPNELTLLNPAGPPAHVGVTALAFLPDLNMLVG